MSNNLIVVLIVLLTITSCGSGTNTDSTSYSDEVESESASGLMDPYSIDSSAVITVSVDADSGSLSTVPEVSESLDSELVSSDFVNSDTVSPVPMDPVPMDPAPATPAPAPATPALVTPALADPNAAFPDAATQGVQPSDSMSQGTGGDSSNPPPAIEAFGLKQRESLSTSNLPMEGAQTGGYQLVNAYPNIAFQEALLVDDVPGQNRLVVVEQFGRIKVFEDNQNVSTSKEILDYSNIVATGGEQGLLGLAFDPLFVENRFVYIYHIQKGSNQSVITRLPWDTATDKLDVSKAKIVLTVEQPFKSHNGGMIVFGKDNYLYIALGDGGDGGDPQNNAQNRSNLLGSVLRIDVNPQDDSLAYVVPASNPFVGEQNVRPEIYAYGFRNPWRMSFDRQTGELWLGDVGQEKREEINVVTAGGNYGWRVYEGTVYKESNLNTLPASAFTAPIHEYTHDLGLSVIGGYVYRGAVRSLQGRYLYTDFYNGSVTALSLNGKTVTSIDSVGSVEGPTSFGETKDGELLVVSRYGGLFKFVENSSSIEFPTTLSQTGLFNDITSLTPNSGLIEYEPSHPFWSDGAKKRRWIGVPDNAKINFSDNDWTFPVGTVSVKHFEMEMIENSPGSSRRLETRILFNTVQGWQGYSYRWNSAQTEALLISERQSEQLSISLNNGGVRQQRYEYPGTADCSTCHAAASTHLLGLETKQLNTNFGYATAADNQLRSFNNIGLFNYDIGLARNYQVLPPLSDETASVEQRARAYLDVNCSTCHQPQGSASSSMDFRMETANSGLNAIGVPPSSNSFGISDAKIIAPGSKERSMVWYRMGVLDGSRMPPISSHFVDQAALRVIGEWIDSM